MIQETRRISWIVYDGIKNSVFKSQVLEPVQRAVDQDPRLEIYLISFELSKLPAAFLQATVPAHNRIHLIICRKMPSWNKATSYLAITQLCQFFKLHPPCEVITRGPIAGFIAIEALKKLFKNYDYKKKFNQKEIFPAIKIQARGLCAEEYRYSKNISQASFFKKQWYLLRYNALSNLEHTIFSKTLMKKYPGPISIEAVSGALKDYLIARFDTPRENITIASKDIPKTIHPRTISLWRLLIRNELGISHGTSVYCYSGSYKPWQCAPETVDYFITQHQNNKKSFLLLLTHDREMFIKHLTAAHVPASSYAVLAVKADDVYRYLAAADYGMLFREKDIINWVSRPTKMLEYQAVGLKIIHNNSIAWLKKKNHLNY